MKSEKPAQGFQEIELKLALPTSDRAGLAQALGGTPELARRKPKQLHLHNIYYDTAEQILRQQRVVLRLRRVGSGAKLQWLQTLKVGGSSDSALSQRGEWETPVASPALSAQALQDTPWASIDPDGRVLAALAPRFVTTFDRTTWRVRRRDRSVVEVALDLGRIEVDGKSAVICELELEVVEGQADALFDVAQKIAASVAVLPLNQSKSQRGYELSQNALDAPLRAQPILLTCELSLAQAASRVLREMFAQFSTNLHSLCRGDDPELVHQARIGWRRFRSALRLFKPALAGQALPSWDGLRPLLNLLGELRDLDVALTETLPTLGDAYTCADPGRAQGWQAMTQALTDAAQGQRKAVRDELKKPAVGASLLGLTQWLECTLSKTGIADAAPHAEVSLRAWSRRRISRLHQQLRAAQKDATTAENEHRTRILAKRLRYGIEALRPLLAKRRTQRWYQQATELQTRMGTRRDVMRMSALVAQLDADRALQEFLRGVALGTQLSR